MTFEQKIAMLVMAKSSKEKAELINKFSSDSEFHYSYNAKRMPLDEFMKQDRFKSTAQYAKHLKEGMRDRGWNRSKTMKQIAEIPEFIWNSRPEFSANLPKKVLAENVRQFIKKYPQFRVDK